MPRWTETITLSRNDPESRAITVDPTEAYLQVGVPVRWVAPQATSFVLAFQDGEAFESGPNVVSSGGDACVGATATPRKPGIFHYAVALTIGDETFMVAGCPSANIRN
jgi:hypothetical protein